jgi:hypothetical protein
MEHVQGIGNKFTGYISKKCREERDKIISAIGESKTKTWEMAIL